MNYLTRNAQDYDTTVSSYLSRAQVNLQTASLPTHLIQFYKQAELYLSKYRKYIQSDSGVIIRIKTQIIVSITGVSD
jgi:hypothetical protein